MSPLRVTETYERRGLIVTETVIIPSGQVREFLLGGLWKQKMGVKNGNRSMN